MPLAQAQIEEAAAFLFHLRVQRETASALPFEIAPRDLDDAYAIQDALHAAAGWPIAVLKVGCTSEFAQQALSIPHPIGGRIPADAVFADGAAIPSSFFNGPPAIECEIALQVDDSGAVVAAAPAMELINPRIQAGGTFGGFTTVADNSAGCAVVLGEPVPIADALPLDGHMVQLTVDDEPLAEGASSAVLGGPESSVDWTRSHEQGRGRRVADGTWIITGTCSGITPSRFDATYRADFGPLGAVSYSTTG